MPGLEAAEVAHGERTRADERHLAAQHVEHVRHLVEREPAQQPADGRHARVVADLEQRAARLVRALELGLLPVGPLDHRAELQHPERPLAQADARIRVEHRPARAELDRGGDREPQGRTGDDDQHADEQVERALRRPVRAGEDRRAQLEERNALPRHVLAALDQKLRGARRHPHLDAPAVRSLHDLEQPGLVDPRIGHDQLVERAVRQRFLDPGRTRLAGELVVDAAATCAERLAQMSP